MSEAQPQAPEVATVEPVVVTLPAPSLDDVGAQFVDAGMDAERVVYVETFEL